MKENALSGEYLFEVYQCAVNFPLLLRNPGKVSFLLNNNYSPAWQVNQTMTDIDGKKPGFIIWDEVWDKVLEVIDEGENLAPLQNYLKRNYELRKEFTPYGSRQMQVWERTQ